MQFCTAIFLVLFIVSQGHSSPLKSLCPNLFSIETSASNQWTGKLKVISENDLQGVWIRLIFDETINELSVENPGFEVELRDNKNSSFLVKNRDFKLNALEPTFIRITAKFEEKKIPNLAEYRLNAFVICPKENSLNGKLFMGDFEESSFLAQIARIPALVESPNCGTTSTAEIKPGKAQSGEWPWQASLYTNNAINNQTYTCEATLITAKHLLTSAHCVTYVNSAIAINPRLLSVHLQNGNEANEIESVTVHNGYRPEGLANDLAVLKLKEGLVIGDLVRPICLGRVDNGVGKSGVLVGREVLVKDGRFGDLAQVEAEVVLEGECVKKTPKFEGLVSDGVFCLSVKKDNLVNVGDSGASFVALRQGSKSVWELKGIVSVGLVWQDNFENVLLVNTANYLKWINSVIF